MDPLSCAASVIAVIQLTGKIAEICGCYIRKAKNANRDILDLQQKISGLAEVLQMLEKLLHEPDGSRLATSRKLFDHVTECSSTLTKVKEKIDPEATRRSIRRLVGALKWPLEQAEVAEAIGAIDDYKSSFSLALQVDQAYVA